MLITDTIHRVRFISKWLQVQPPELQLFIQDFRSFYLKGWNHLYGMACGLHRILRKSQPIDKYIIQSCLEDLSKAYMRNNASLH